MTAWGQVGGSGPADCECDTMEPHVHSNLPAPNGPGEPPPQRKPPAQAKPAPRQATPPRAAEAPPVTGTAYPRDQAGWVADAAKDVATSVRGVK